MKTMLWSLLQSIVFAEGKKLPKAAFFFFEQKCTNSCNFFCVNAICAEENRVGRERLKKQYDSGRQKNFCRAFLKTMDPERAAEETGFPDGFALLATKPLQQKLEKMRETAVGQIRREDVLRRLAQLAFGRANDIVKLALSQGVTEAEQLDLSAVSEFKVTDKGGMEVKMVDRIRALETLFHSSHAAVKED